jgi:sugar lactone lactonase YvrE
MTPRGVAVDASGNVYVTYLNVEGSPFNAVMMYDPDGWYVKTLASGFTVPDAIAVDSRGTVYVADAGSNAIMMVRPDGTMITFGEGFNSPSGIAVDGLGKVYVADAGNGAIKRVDGFSDVVKIVNRG